jgi:hypothetical protein
VRQRERERERERESLKEAEREINDKAFIYTEDIQIF